MQLKSDRFVSPLAKARGLGSAKEGVEHWMNVRISALALVPLVFWAVYSIIDMLGATYTDYALWIQDPVNAVLSILFIAVSFYHGVMGAQEIIEDYVTCKVSKLGSIIGLKLFFGALGVLTIFSILKVAL